MMTEPAAPYTVRLPVFEGPFDLLLHLIRINEMDINDIRISDITRQYLDYIRMMRELDLELAGDFLVMAATLINLKARTLLPVPPELEEQSAEIEEVLSASDLVRQLVEYRKFKEAASALREREAEASRVIYRTNVLQVIAEPAEELSVDINLLYRAFARVLAVVDAPAYQPEFQERYSVEDKIEYIADLCGREGQVDLFALFRRCFGRAEIIVTFLAVLELTRLKQIGIRQDGQFDSIMIYQPSGDEPSPGVGHAEPEVDASSGEGDGTEA